MQPAPRHVAAWLAEELVAPPAADDAQRRADAWALKDAAYASMYTDLPRAERAAGLVSGLAEGAGNALIRAELAALAQWLNGTVAALAGEPARALQHLQAASEGFSALAAHQHAASAQVPQIVALAMLGRHDEAMHCAQRTLSAFIALGDEGAAGKVELNLGSMLLRQDRYAEAAQHYRRAAVRFARANDRRHSVMADIGLASALSWQFEFDEATRIYERAAARTRAHALGGLQGIIDASRGWLALQRGEHAKALRWLEAALREFERSGPPQRLAEAKMDLAAAYFSLNLLPEAQSLYEQAMHLCESAQAPVERAWASAQLALVHMAQGREAGAADLLSQARAALAAQGNVVAQAQIQMHEARLQLRRGNAAAALVSARAARSGLAQAGMRTWELDAALSEAQALAASGMAAQAEQVFAEVRDIAPNHPELCARALSGLAELAYARGDRGPAWQALQQAAQRIDQQQASLGADEFRVAYRSDKQAIFDRLMLWALDTPEGCDGLTLLQEVDRARSRALQLAPRRPSVAAPQAEAQRRAMHWLQGQWRQALASGDSTRAASLKNRSAVLESEALEAWRRAQAAAASEPLTAPDTDWDLASLSTALGPNRALLAYAWVGERLVALVLRGGQLNFRVLSANGLGARIESLRFQLNTMRFGAQTLQRHAAQLLERTQQHLRALYEQVWAPVAPWLQDVQEVVLMPHRALHYLPFAALRGADGPVLDRHALSLAPSIGLWLRMQAAAPPRWCRALALGVGGEALPHVRAEIKALEQTFGADAARCLLDQDARVGALRKGLEGGVGGARVDLLHLACHAQFRADSPYFSSLQLADGALTVLDAASLPLQGVAVTLSACETGMSKLAPGDEQLGLVRGFLLAGAPVVMSTLWPVDDESTAWLMGEFYSAVRSGQRPAAALRKAQMALRERCPHPYHFAPFVLHGWA
jgi:CHAT domain-containing protein